MMEDLTRARASAPQSATRVDRRWAMKAGGTTGLAALLAGRAGIAGASDRGNNDHQRRGIEPDAGEWRTWTSVEGISVPPPPKGGAEKAELRAVRAAAAGRDGDMVEAIGFWDTGAPSYRWIQIAHQTVLGDPAQDTFRVPAYVAIAIYDATVAAWAAKQRYHRARPHEQDPSIVTAAVHPQSPSYPSEHGATAGAAVAVLAALYPTKAGELEQLAKTHGASRVAAGVEFPSDFDAGYALGKAVGARFADMRIGHDGFGDPYPGDVDAPYPGGDGSFPLTPAEETAMFGAPQLMIGRWKPLILDDVTAFRPPLPPAAGSPARAAELAEVKNFDRRHPPLFSELFFWAEDPAGRPEPDTGAFVNTTSAAFYYAVDVSLIVHDELAQKILEYRLDGNAPQAARAYALTYATMFDAFVSCWESKYHFLVGRPIHFDPAVDTLWPTYDIAAYPSGHSTNLTATATVLGHLFPRDAGYFLSRAKENAASRLWAGIHFRSDFVEGVAMGQRIGSAAIAWAEGEWPDSLQRR